MSASCSAHVWEAHANQISSRPRHIARARLSSYRDSGEIRLAFSISLLFRLSFPSFRNAAHTVVSSRDIPINYTARIFFRLFLCKYIFYQPHCVCARRARFLRYLAVFSCTVESEMVSHNALLLMKLPRAPRVAIIVDKFARNDWQKSTFPVTVHNRLLCIILQQYLAIVTSRSAAISLREKCSRPSVRWMLPYDRDPE